MSLPRTPLPSLGDGGPRYATPGEGAPAPTRSRENLTRLLAVMLVLRGVLSFTDALSVANEGLRPLPIVGPVAFSAASPLWSAVWGCFAIAAGVALGRRWRFGWLAGAAVAFAYLVSGIADLSLLDWSMPALQPERLYAVSVDLLVPAAALALLSMTRAGYLQPRRPRRWSVVAQIARRESGLDLWRRRR